MHRRTFIASLPATALLPTLASAQRGTASIDPAPGPGQGAAPATDTNPTFWAPGEERFLRPDVHAGDRPMLPPTSHTLSQLGRFADVAAALAGSPPDPLEPIMPGFEDTPEGRFAVLPNGEKIPLVAPRRG